MANDFDRLLSQYSEPVRSWPGEEARDKALDEEAIQAAKAAGMYQVPETGINRDSIFPVAYDIKNGVRSQSGQFAVPGMLKDMGHAVEAVGSAPLFGPIQRPSQMGQEAIDEMLGHVGAWVGPQGAGFPAGAARAALTHAPAGTQDLGVFGGAKAKTANHAALARAEEMAAAGLPREQIWNEAGWFQGVDGKWRFEIDDSAAKYVGKFAGKGVSDQMGRLVEHPEFYAAYPEVAGIKGVAYRNSADPMHGGYRPAVGNLKPEISLSAPTLEEMRSGMLHEMQHAGPQEIEGFAKGGNEVSALLAANDKDFASIKAEYDAYQKGIERTQQMRDEIGRLSDDRSSYTMLGSMKPEVKSRIDALWGEIAATDPLRRGELPPDAMHEFYRRLAGEVEARTVQARKDMTPEERRSRAPWLDYDIPEEKQIVRMGGEGPQKSIPESLLPMDEASRLARAREMGFDTDNVWYHGSEKSGFPAFDESMIGSGGKPTHGFWFTENRRNAQTYAGRNREADIISDPEFDARHEGDRGIYSTYVRPGKQKVEDWGGGNWDEGPLGYSADKAAEYAKRDGYDSLLLNNITDEGPHGQGYHWGNQSLVVFDPSNIRSVNAEFNPAKSSSPNLLASDTTSPQAVNMFKRSLDNLGYYSPTIEAALRIAQAKGTPEQMIAQMKKAGAKDAEIEATGLSKALEGKKSVTKDEIVQHLEGNRPDLKEVSYARDTDWPRKRRH